MEKFEPHLSNYLEQFDKGAEYFQSIKGPGETEHFCVIVEPRKHPYLLPVIKNFMMLLQSKGWGLIILHGTENETFVKEGLAGWKTPVFISLGVDNMPGKIYNEYLKSAGFWKQLLQLGCKRSLIFQVDTLLFDTNIEDFFEYDYVGAPWLYSYFPEIPQLHVGNGGLSLRKTEIMLELCERYANNPEYPVKDDPNTCEDMWFCYHLYKYGYKVPSIQVAKKFSIETIPYAKPMGLHNPQVGELIHPDMYAYILSKRHTFD
jgi:hypothetical protein